jgi:hypothetical protein
MADQQVAAKQQALEQKTAAELAKAMKQQQQQIQSAAKAAAAAAKLQERLKLAKATVAEKLADKDGIDQSAAVAAVDSVVTQYLALKNSTPQGAMQVIRAALAAHDKKGGPAFQDAASAIITDLGGG